MVGSSVTDRLLPDNALLWSSSLPLGRDSLAPPTPLSSIVEEERRESMLLISTAVSLTSVSISLPLGSSVNEVGGARGGDEEERERLRFSCLFNEDWTATLLAVMCLGRAPEWTRCISRPRLGRERVGPRNPPA